MSELGARAFGRRDLIVGATKMKCSHGKRKRFEGFELRGLKREDLVV
jgi:hypothetical protein